MQPLPFLSADLFAPGQAPATPAAKSGPDGRFASALASAANEQNGNASQSATHDTGKAGSLQGRPTAGVGDTDLPEEDTDPLELETSINGSAGAINLVMHFPQWSASGTGLANSTAITRELPEQSAVSQMLAAIALTGKIASANAPQAGTPTPDSTPQGNTQATGSETAATEIAATQAQNGAILLNKMDVVQPALVALPDEPSQPTVATVMTVPVAEAAIAGDAGQTTVGDPGQIELAPSTAAPIAEPAGRQPAPLHDTTPQEARVSAQATPAQVVVTSQPNADEQAPQTDAPNSAAAAGNEITGLRQETNGDFIRSNLPNKIAHATQDEEANTRQDQAADKGRDNGPAANTTGQSTNEMLAQRLQAAAAQDGQPLIFAHQLDRSQTAAASPATQASTDPSLVRLPSGTLVPQGAAMDQMIAHLTMNKHLETSTINLKLHPQELGELRMEIKVEQDNIKAHIIAQSPHAQEMIDRHLPRLREALEQQGLHLSQVEVTLAANDRTDNQAFQDSLSQNMMHRSLKNKSTQATFPLNAIGEAEETVQAPITLSVMA